MFLNIAQSAPAPDAPVSPSPTPTPTPSPTDVMVPEASSGPPSSDLVQQAKDSTFLESCTNYAETLFNSIWRFEWLETTAFTAAIVLLVGSGAVAIWKEWKKTPEERTEEREQRLRAVGQPPTIIDLIKVLPDLIKALASAPAAVVLLVMGLLMAWHPHQEIETPPTCEVVIKQGLLEAPEATSGEPENSEE